MKKAKYYLNIANMKLSEIHKPTREDRSSVMLKAIKQAQSEAISETVKACDKNVVSGSMRSRWETIEQELKAKL